jgi:molybdate transport system substrate-binding protein
MVRWRLLLIVLTVAGCTGDAANHEQSTVVVFAAASTGNTMDKITEQFSQQRKTIKIQTSYAASSTLAQQIAEGADAQVYVSANERWADYLQKQDLVAQRRDLLSNRLVVIQPADSTVEVKTPADLQTPAIAHLALADPEAVPAGIYAKQALVKLGLWGKLKSKVVAAADVQHVLSYVELGAAEAGIIYSTDARGSNSVKVAVEIDPKLTEPILYPIVLLREGQDRPAAEAFYQYLCGPEAAKIFQDLGFVVLGNSTDADR